MSDGRKLSAFSDLVQRQAIRSRSRTFWDELQTRVFNGPPIVLPSSNELAGTYQDISTAQEVGPELNVDMLLKAKEMLMRNDPPPAPNEWHCGGSVISTIKRDIKARTWEKGLVDHGMKIGGMAVYEDPRLPDNVFELRDDKGNVLGRYCLGPSEGE